MICLLCRRNRHGECRGGTWCDCAHRADTSKRCVWVTRTPHQDQQCLMEALPGQTLCAGHPLEDMTEDELGEFYYQNRHRLNEFFEPIEETNNDRPLRPGAPGDRVQQH